MSYRTNDYPLACRQPFNRIEDPVVPHAGCPSPGEPAHELLSNGIGFDSEVLQGLEHGVTE